jgi:hypothetical protein
MKPLAVLLLLTASFTPTVRACAESETTLSSAAPRPAGKAVLPPARATDDRAAAGLKRVAAAAATAPQKTQKAQPAKPKPAPAPKPKPSAPPYLFM